MSAVRRAADVLSGVVFRTVEVRRVDPEPTGPALILASHGGGLADILAVVDSSDRFPRFLARDVIWRLPGGAAVMSWVRAIPVHRRQDHGGSADNADMFAEAVAGLAEGDVLAIYPEGESSPEPRLAPLRTGAARIALQSLAAGTDITFVPTGLHYFDVSVLRGRCFVDIGPTFTCTSAVAAARQAAGSELGEPSPTNHALVKAVTGVLEQHLSDVADEYDGWEQRRRYEVAATTYLRHRTDSPGASTSFEQVATTAGQIARAPEVQRERIDVDVRALEAELEILGLSGDRVSEASLAGPALARQTGLMAALAIPGAYGLLVNSVPMLLIRAASMSGMAPATAATAKPAIATIAFPAAWAVLGRIGYRWHGPIGAAAAALSGPASLIAAVALGERAQLMFYLGRAVRRARGPMLHRLVSARDAVVASVAAGLAAEPHTWPPAAERAAVSATDVTREAGY
ncbi:MAG: 1-acyl-sn-glycerol-3-phosphate acyltransferase [Candidatus Nanopelagicales bacterium]